MPPQPRMQTTDRQIDALVYELYGLTEEESAIVEGRSRTGLATWFEDFALGGRR